MAQSAIKVDKDVDTSYYIYTVKNKCDMARGQRKHCCRLFINAGML